MRLLRLKPELHITPPSRLQYMGSYVDNVTVLNLPLTQTFWELGGWQGSGLFNPWTSGGPNAPFDQVPIRGATIDGLGQSMLGCRSTILS